MTFITNHTTPYPDYSNDKVANSVDTVSTNLSMLSNAITETIRNQQTTVTKRLQNDEAWLQLFCALISNSSAGAKMAMPSYAKLADQALEEFNNRYPF